MTGTPPPLPPPPLPAPAPKLRPDGSVRGMRRGIAIAVVAAGVALIALSIAVLVPAFVDQFTGPRFAIPGSRTVDLDTGTWTIYEHTLTDSDDDPIPGGRDLGFLAASVRVDGPAPAEVWDHRGSTETITRGNRTYLGVVRFEIAESGPYTITIAGEPGDGGEVLVARPLSNLFGRWPWMLGVLAGITITVLGGIFGLTGAANRRVARRAGVEV